MTQEEKNAQGNETDQGDKGRRRRGGGDAEIVQGDETEREQGTDRAREGERHDGLDKHEHTQTHRGTQWTKTQGKPNIKYKKVKTD